MSARGADVLLLHWQSISPQAHIYAIDLSSDALAVARQMSYVTTLTPV
jgi:ubiquinone/menaquinone biosynthesis C-methylase UbiE